MSALDKTKKKFIEVAMQQELCRMMSSEFENVNKLEVTPFMAVMRMIKLEYNDTRPELYKMLVTVMQDYNTYGGPQHRRMTIKYINILLDGHPEMAHYLVSILPPLSTATTSQHALHTTAGSAAEEKTEKVENSVARRPLEPVPDNVQPPNAKKQRKQEPVKFYNFTTPAVNAYVASQGIPSKITSVPHPSAVQPIASYAQVTTNVLLPSELAKANKVNLNQIQVTPIIGSIVVSTDPCVTSAVNPLVKMLNPANTHNALVAYDLDRKRGFLGADLLMVAESFRNGGDISAIGVNKVHAMTGTCAPNIPGYTATSKGTWVPDFPGIAAKGVVNAKSADARVTTVKKILKKELGCASTTTPAVSSQGLLTAIQPQPPGVHKVANIEPNLPAKQGKSMMTVAEIPGAKTVRNLASFPYGQQMLFSNGMKQSIVVNSPIPTQADRQIIDSAGLVVDLSNGVKPGEVPRQPTEAVSGHGKRQSVPPTQRETPHATAALPSRTPLQCLQQMVENTGKDRDVGYVEMIRDKLLNSVDNMTDPDTDVSSTTEPVTGITVMTAGDCDASDLGSSTECIARSVSTGEANASRSGVSEFNTSQSDLLDSEDDVIVMSQYDGTSDCDSSVDQDTPSEINSPKGATLDVLPDRGFEPHDYLARLTDTPSPPNYNDPWGQGKAKKRSSKKKRRK